MPRLRQMAEEAGRDPQSLSVTLGSAPEDIEVLKRNRDLGVTRMKYNESSWREFHRAIPNTAFFPQPARARQPANPRMRVCSTGDFGFCLRECAPQSLTQNELSDFRDL
jgi:hypothetical protein